MNQTPLGPADLKIYREAAAAALLWHFRLHPRPISSESEDVPDHAHGEIAFGAMVSHGPVSFPPGTSMEGAERFWSANLYKAEAAALLAVAPREAERRALARSAGGGARLSDLGPTERGTLARAAEALGVHDRQTWFQEIRMKIDRLFDDPLVWNGVEVLVTAARGRGALSDHEVEHFLERAGTPRTPWPDWMPGSSPNFDFYFD